MSAECPKRGRTTWAASAALVAAVLASRTTSGQVFTPDLTASPSAAEARSLLAELERLERLPSLPDGLMSSRLDQLAAMMSSRDPVVLGERDGVVETLAGRVRRLAGRWGWSADGPSDRVWEGQARQRLAALLQARAGPAELARWAATHGPTRVAGEAWAEAALCLYHRGDEVAAAELAARARALGVEVSWPGPAPDSGALAASARAAGSLRGVWSAWWFDKRPDRLGAMRVLPVAVSPERSVWAGRHQTVCLEWAPGAVRGASRGVATGRLRVVWVSPETPRGAVTGLRLPGRRAFPVYGGGAGGAALQDGVVVVREVREAAGNVGGWPGGGAVLRALRAADGVELWSSEAVGALAESHVASLPVVVGGTVYAVVWERPTRAAADRPVEGGRPAEREGSLSAVALELTTGVVVWRTRLGAVSAVPLAGRGPGRVDALAMRESPPLWDDSLAVAAGGEGELAVAAGGMLVVLDRFDGSVLGATRYPSVGAVAREGAGPSEAPMSRWGAGVMWAGSREAAGSPGGAGRAVRAGGVWMVAARDTDGVLAVDAQTRAVRWRQPRLGAATLAGVTADGSGVLLQGEELTLLDAATGAPRWSVFPRTQTRWTGPAVLLSGVAGDGGEVVAVPTDRGVAGLDALTGQWLDGGSLEALVPGLTDLSRALRGEVAVALRRAGVLEALLSPGAIDELLGGEEAGRGGGGPGGAGAGGGQGGGPQRVVPPPQQPPRPTPRGPVPPPRVEPRRSGG